MPAILENREKLLTPIALCELSELLDELRILDGKVTDYDKKIKLQAQNNDDCQISKVLDR